MIRRPRRSTLFPYPPLSRSYGIVLAAWLAATAILFAGFGAGLRAGKPWDRALPDGYIGSLGAALIFGAAWIVDNGYWADRKSTRLNSSHLVISYAVFCLKKK